MIPALTFVFLVLASTSALEIELQNAEMADIEILFPKADNPVNSVPSTTKEREQSNRLINFLDRLLNRNQGTNNNLNNNNNNNNANNNNNNNLNLNNQQTVASQVLASTRRSLLSSLIFIPDVNKGVDTILGGVASGNLEQVISGSFIFTPNRVQSVANTVINRVFGGGSLGNLNNNGQNNNNNNNNNFNNNNNNNLNKNLNQTGSSSGTGNQQQQFQVLSTALNQINGQNSNEQQQQQQQQSQLSASELEQLQQLQQLQNSQLANFENKNKGNELQSNGVQQLRSNGTASNNGGGFTNLLSGVFGQIFSSNPKNSTNNINANNNQQAQS